MEHILQVATQGALVGRVGFDSNDERFTFHYDDAWRARDDSYPLSPHIPLNGDAPKSASVQRFLANLLPEGRALDVASIASQISKDNIFGLVRVLGKEPVGALSFQPFPDGASAALAPALAPQRRVISDAELSERIRDRDTLPFPVWDQKVRLSVAGYQDKLQVLVEGDRLSLADGSLSSTHILKPDSRNAATPHMVANEHFCMTLAARMGLPVAPVSLRRILEPVLLIERFDREIQVDDARGEATTVRRIHAIDGCQALDASVSYKYERNFGNAPEVRNIREDVSFERLFSIGRLMENPAQARGVMLRWALFQLLIGNSDAHGKNISFFVRHSGLSPAPFYDLVSVNVYGDGVEQDMAMAYGDVFHLGDITPFAMADFAHRTATQPAFLARELTRLAKLATRTADELAASESYIGDERALVHDIARFIAVQSEHLTRLAPAISKVDKALL
ncbi:Protein hipA [Candidatus Burkholderia verschuerenii]|uniref:Protein hipA n=1 Tax=Candidatus Burkholderia verschuerenii TaxID=242163 RepID=A0A0L0MBY1_9BURK|nr:HipA domain-containing protein [Candidatus Burkholderia verschuerenii]KND59858.1 Protein hipA [Candidatus Burkholderia verschuerenii]